jgi:hypothetical protein
MGFNMKEQSNGSDYSLANLFVNKRITELFYFRHGTRCRCGGRSLWVSSLIKVIKVQIFSNVMVFYPQNSEKVVRYKTKQA